MKPFITISIAIATIAFPARIFALERSPKSDSVTIFHSNNTDKKKVAQNDTDFFFAQDSFNRGKRKLAQNNYQEAIEEFNRASIEEPNNAYIYFYRGSAYYQLEKIEEAIALFH